MVGVQYKVLFEGKLLPGFDEVAVRSGFARRFKVGEERVNRLFSGRPCAIGKGLSEKEAKKYQKTLSDIGAECRIIKIKDEIALSPAKNSQKADQPMDQDNAGKQSESTFNILGRTGRIRFLALSWLVVFIEVAAVMLPGYIPRLSGGALTVQETVSMVVGIHALAALLMIYLTITRLHDMDRTGGLWPFLLIPVVNLLFLLWLSFAPGSKSRNAYGNPPPRAGNLAWAIGVYFPVCLLLIAAAAGYLYQNEILAQVQQLPAELSKWTGFEYRG